MLTIILLLSLVAVGVGAGLESQLLPILVASAIAMCIGSYVLTKSPKLVTLGAGLLLIYASNFMIRDLTSRGSSVTLPGPIQWLGNGTVVTTGAVIVILAAFCIGKFGHSRV